MQAGIFRNPDNARRLLQALNALVGEARIVTRPAAPGLIRVVVGDRLMESEARALASRTQAACKECSGAYVVRLDAASRGDH